MPRILLTTFGSYGDINPIVGLALALRARGHDVAVATSEYYRPYIEREALAFRPVRPDADPNDRALVARIMDARTGSEFLLRELLFPRIQEMYDDLSAAVDGFDLLVTHPVTFAGPIVAEERRLPWVSTVLAPMSFFSPHDLPVFPQAGWMKRLEAIPGIARLLVRLAKGATARWMAPVASLRAARGLPPGANPLFEGQHSPSLVLALFSPLLGGPQPDWPPNVQVTGPVWYNGPASQPLSPELERFLADGPPPVVFTLGSSAVSAAGSFYEVSAQAAARTGCRAVLLTGTHPENQPRSPLPAGIVAIPHAPHAALLPHAAATVHQCGVGTLHQALRAGKPMLAVPHAHDQPDNAYRAQRLGVAIALRPAEYSVERVSRALQHLLGDPTYAQRASAVAARLREEDGATRACQAIERLTS